MNFHIGPLQRRARAIRRALGRLYRALPPLARRETIKRINRETLGRAPVAEELARGARHRGTDSLRHVLEQSPEHEQIIRPLDAAVRAVYSRYLFREPTNLEVARHVGLFRTKHPTDEQCLRAIAGGDVRKGLGIRLLKVEMDLTNKCNLRCRMCYFSDPRVFRRARHAITVEEFARLAEQLFPLSNEVALSFGTEPLLHPRFGELLAVAKAYEVPSVWITTNGLLLNGEVIDKVIALGLDTICVSIDAATKETYERIRVGGNFERLLANIRALQGAKQHRGSDRPRLMLNVVLMRSNIEELPDVFRLAHELQAVAVGAVHMVPFENASAAPGESLFEHQELCNRMLDEARAAALRHGVYAHLPENFGARPDGVRAVDGNEFYTLNMGEGETSLSACRFPWHFVGISPYGDVSPCGWWYGEPPMCNLHEQTFDEIWDNASYRALRAEHLGSRLRPTCQTCPAAGLGDLNDRTSFRVQRPLHGYWVPA
jgi:radical SAM protein with 4Fe4S-binding SPASM domain